MRSFDTNFAPGPKCSREDVRWAFVVVSFVVFVFLCNGDDLDFEVVFFTEIQMLDTSAVHWYPARFGSWRPHEWFKIFGRAMGGTGLYGQPTCQKCVKHCKIDGLTLKIHMICLKENVIQGFGLVAANM